jgi:hypothetical protein
MDEPGRLSHARPRGNKPSEKSAWPACPVRIRQSTRDRAREGRAPHALDRADLALDDPRLRIHIIPKADRLPLLDCRRSTLGAGEDRSLGPGGISPF